ncbi:MAG: 50S ribosomal protein L11 [Candidatus Berkelbacteria bacterium]|nr:50S ribosomal protein L11 [Candidatus Berkelbacteria bacterium]
MAKKIKSIIKLQCQAGKANPAPPVGPALGQHGLNIMDFCQKFNEATKKMEPGMVVPVEVTVFEDRTFDFKLKTPPASFLLKKAAKIEKGSGNVPKDKVGKITKGQLNEIARMKMEDLSARDLDQAVKIIEGTAKSMGIEVIN